MDNFLSTNPTTLILSSVVSEILERIKNDFLGGRRGGEGMVGRGSAADSQLIVRDTDRLS